jgi:glycosyltransferase involved in cell wall biosynthesis
VQIFEMEESFGWARRLVGRGAAIVERLHGPHAFVREWTETRGQRAEGDLKEAAEFDSMRRVQAVTAPTQALLDALAGQYRVTLPLTRAIPNPIPVASGAVQWRIDDADPNQLLYVGRFDSLKGADIVLQAFEQALQRRPSLTLVIAGPDLGLIDGGGALVHFEEFSAREMSAQARARVRFLGAQAPARVADLRLQSGVSILTSRFENFPYSIAEAMAAGMPVLASNTFGAREMIRDGIEGRIVPAEDVEATAEVMVAMASNPLQLAAMGKAGRERVTEWLSPERIARETVEVYREALRRL